MSYGKEAGNLEVLSLIEALGLEDGIEICSSDRISYGNEDGKL